MGVLTSRPPGRSPSEGRRLPPMTTPLQAARRARGWSQARMVWELMRLAERKKIGVASAASLKTQLSRWENGHVTPDYYQALLCELLGATPGELGFGIQELPSGPARESSPGTTLIAKREWTRDDLNSLSASFDDAISSSVLADIEMLAHEWLAADKTPAHRVECRPPDRRFPRRHDRAPCDTATPGRRLHFRPHIPHAGASRTSGHDQTT